MRFQLTVSKADLPAGMALRRKRVSAYDQALTTLGGAGADCVLEGLEGVQAALEQDAEERFRVKAMTGEVCLNGSACGEEARAIHSGDTLSVGGWNVQFHLCLPKARLSWRSSLLAGVTKGAIAVIFAVLLAAMFWLPKVLSSGRVWNQFADLERVSLRLDAEREKLRTLGSKERKLSLGKTLLLEQLTAEIEDRTRYVRNYDHRLSKEQFMALQEDLDSLQALIEFVGDDSREFPELPSPAIEAAVQAILVNP